MPLSQLGQIAFGGSRAGQGNSARDRMKEEQYKAQLAEYEADMERRRTIAGQQFRGSNIGEFIDQLNPQQQAIARFAQANMMGEHVAEDSGTRITELLKQFGSQHSPQPTATMQDFDRFVPPGQHEALYRQKLLKPSSSVTVHGDQAIEEPIKVTDLRNLQMPIKDEQGNIVRWDTPPYGTLPSQAQAMGVRVREEGDVSGGDAGKTASLTYAQQKQEELNSLIYDQDGKIRSDVVRAAWATSKWPLAGPITSQMMTLGDNEAAQAGQRAWGLVDQNTQAVLRTETGAAMGEGEIDNILARYLPGPMDSDALMAQKFQDLQNVTSLMVQMLDPNSEFMKRTANLGPSQRGEELKAEIGRNVAPTDENRPLTKDEWRKAREEGRIK